MNNKQQHSQTHPISIFYLLTLLLAQNTPYHIYVIHHTNNMVLWNENKSRTFAPTNKDKTTELLTYLKKK